ncbi:radical SAM protein [Candidatus Woesearchaeota archaeon]|nr:radical SAM protein [Candidatus Woesearchaeota archaeon]
MAAIKVELMYYTLLDCYTDEASGLGVPPYLGTYPRYLFGKLNREGHQVAYLTIDDLRLWKKYGGIKKEVSVKEKTKILIYNTTINDAREILSSTEVLVVIMGVHVPGKYLTALPGALREVIPLIKGLPMKKILTGPAIFGTQLEGGRFYEQEDLGLFDEIKNCNFSFVELKGFIQESRGIIKQIPARRVIEIETGRGCNVGKCSFCTEPIKSKFINRPMEEVVEEVKLFYDLGARFFRLGKQADFYASDRPMEMLRQIREQCPDLELLHIDNVNPNSVVKPGGEEITAAIVKYCTPGNIAAFGVESFDSGVVKANLLNTSPLIAYKAVEIINKHGAERGGNGLPKFLPGINIIFGLLNETKDTNSKNMEMLQKIIDRGLLLRRINIRQVAVLPNTYLEKHGGNKYLRKNKHLYWKWRNEIRQKIDRPMLAKILPKGTILTDVYTEMYDGKTTFCRQMATYPLVVGVKGRLPLGQKIKIKVAGYMLRSIVGEVVE